MRINTVYFKEASSGHTNRVIQCVDDFLNENPQVRKIVVATTGGETGLKAVRAFSDKEVIVVTHQIGFLAPDHDELSPEKREEIRSAGGKILTTTHAFAGVGRSMRKMFDTWTVPEIFSIAYRTFGQGTKVCAEIALMAADSGLVSVNEDVVCIGGTGKGADTAWLVRPAHTSNFPELRMKGCICKPLEF